MKKRFIKRGTSGLFAFVLAAALLITSLNPLQVNAEETFDSTAPVVESFSATPSVESPTLNDTFNIQIQAYDAQSDIKTIRVGYYNYVGGTMKNDSVTWFKDNQENVGWTVNGKVYSCAMKLSNMRPGTVSISSIYVEDTNGNYKEYNDLLFDDSHEYKYTTTVSDVVAGEITLESLNLHLHDATESLWGKTVDYNGNLAIDGTLTNGDQVSQIEMEFNPDANPGNYVIFRLTKNENGTFGGGPWGWSNQNGLYKLKRVKVTLNDGTVKTLDLSNVTADYSYNYVQKNSSVIDEANYAVNSIKFFKDNVEVNNGDIVKPGDDLKVEVRTTGVTAQIPNEQICDIYYKALGNNVASSSSGTIKQNADDNNLFEGTVEITDTMYPTAWTADGVYICGKYTATTDVSTSFMVQKVNGDSVVPMINPYYVYVGYWMQNESGDWAWKQDSVSLESVPAYSQLPVDKLNLPKNLESPISGAEFVGWHVVSYSNSGATDLFAARKDLGDVKDYTLTPARNYVYVQAVYSKDIYAVSGNYRTEDGYEEFRDIISTSDEGFDADKLLVKYNNQYGNSVNKDLQFNGFKFRYAMSNTPFIIVEPQYKNVEVNVSYRYIDKNSEVAEVTESKWIPREQLTNDYLKSCLNYKAPETKAGETFDKWTTTSIMNNNNFEYTSDVYHMSCVAKYKNKNVILANYVYVPETDLCDRKVLFVNETESVENIKKLVKDNEPTKVPIDGMIVVGWEPRYYQYAANTNFTSFSEYAQFKNSLVVYNLSTKEGVSNYQEEAYYKVVPVGTKVVLPTSLYKFKDIKYFDVWGAYEGNDNGDDNIKSSYITKAGYLFLNGEGTYVKEGTGVTDGGINGTETKPAPKPETKPNPTPQTPIVTQPGTVAEVTSDNKVVIKLEPQVIQQEVTVVKTAVEEAKEIAKKVAAGTAKKETPKVDIDMKGATVVPVDILEAAKGADIDVVLDMGGYSWTINGNDIKGANLKDINLEVKVGADVVPNKLIQKLAGDKPTTQLSLTHSGDFGFKASLNVEVGKDNAGQFGNLFYYDSDGKLVFMNAGKIEADGTVSLDFSHASDYVVVVGEDMTSEYNKDGSPKMGDNNNTLLFVVIMFVGIGAIAFARKKAIK